MRGEFDAVIACYHNQGLIPVKLVAFGRAVNVTLGLPIVRTSVDHGTAFDIAGQGIADPSSLIEAIKLAAQLVRKGTRYQVRVPGTGYGYRGVNGGVKQRSRVFPVSPDLVPGTGTGHLERYESEREQAQKSIAENRKAFHDYHILETFEAGVQLHGKEVKAIREGNVNLRDSYARLDDGEVWIYNVHINPYSHRGYADHRRRASGSSCCIVPEIRKLIGRTVERGLTLVPPDVPSRMAT